MNFAIPRFLLTFLSMFGVAEQSFVSQLSFTPPRSYRVFWHRFVQPSREAERFSAKITSLFLRSERASRVFGGISFWGLVLCAVAVITFTLLYLGGGVEWDLPISTTIVMIPFVVAFMLYATGGRFPTVWAKRSVTVEQLSGSLLLTPRFALQRASEVRERAESKGGTAVFEYHWTYKDPIIKAIVDVNGKTEKFVVAVYYPWDKNPLCE